MFNKKIFSARLDELRSSSNLSYAELGTAVGISKVSIHHLVKAINYPHCNTLLALADYFQVSIDYLVGRTDNPEVNLGRYSATELPKAVDKEVQQAMKQFKKEFVIQQRKSEEAMQKMAVAYAMEDSDAKIQFLNQIIELDPDVYNAYVTLGYVYWYHKNNFDAARMCFNEEFRRHPDNYQVLCDLAALALNEGSPDLALKYIEQAITIRPDIWDTLQTDPRFDSVRPS